MHPTVLGVKGPGFLNQVPTINPKPFIDRSLIVTLLDPFKGTLKEGPRFLNQVPTLVQKPLGVFLLPSAFASDLEQHTGREAPALIPRTTLLCLGR